ncbi:MAG TPA: type IV pilus modification protein PilV [Gammaproteobacteria bacterium]
MARKHCTKIRNSTGVSMIEILVTIVVLSIGLLGMAALQLTGMRSTNSATYRTQATLLANDIAERMRANIDAVNENLYMNVDSASNINCGAFPATHCSEYYNAGAQAATACTTAQMAAYDINIWFCGVNSNGARAGGVQAALPQAAATITCTDTNPTGGDVDPCTDRSPHTITVSWSEINPDKSGADTVSQSVSMTIQQ